MGPLMVEWGQALGAFPMRAATWWRRGRPAWRAPRQATVRLVYAGEEHVARAIATARGCHLVSGAPDAVDTELLSATDAVLRRFELPARDARERARMFELELESSIPCAVEELEVRSACVGERHMIAFLARRGGVHRRCVPEPAVWARALARVDGGRTQSAVVLDGEHTRCIVARDGLPLHVETCTTVGEARLDWLHRRREELAAELDIELPSIDWVLGGGPAAEALATSLGARRLAGGRALAEAFAELAVEGTLRFDPRRVRTRLGRWGWVPVAALALLGALALGRAELAVLDGRVQTLRGAVEKSEESAAETRSMLAELEADAVRDDRALELLAALAAEAPRGLQLDRVSVRAGKSVLVEGSAATASALISWVDALGGDDARWQKLWIDRLHAIDGEGTAVRFQVSGVPR